MGFRPFVYNLAKRLDLTGWVENNGDGVTIEVQGESSQIDNFAKKLERDKPSHASIFDLQITDLPPRDESSFSIRTSSFTSSPSAVVLPDLAPCQACLKEMMTPGNRRYRYPFTNCTHCGPRFTIIERLPYDRQNTTMKAFTMCSDCQKEYEDPSDRRFHAQPNACPICGPQVELWNGSGEILAKGDGAIQEACERLQGGAILALKGVGGFHLILDAKNDESIRELRKRKGRPEKPFALMYASLDQVREDCFVSKQEEKLLTSQEAPIVLLKSHRVPSREIAPDNPYLGVMLPSSPLHHVLLNGFERPLIATSGNRSDEPICFDEKEAVRDLDGIADFFLVHNRPIRQFIDDSIVRLVAGRKLTLRRARGYASLPIYTRHKLPVSLAVGAHLKNTIGVAKGNRIYLSHHLGNLETQKACEAFKAEIRRLQEMYAIDPEIIVSDRHTGYFSTQHACEQPSERKECQHHLAHVYSCMAENRVESPLLGISWDGTGQGLDGSLWGGEFFELTDDDVAHRVAFFRPFLLPGGERAIRDPRLIAAGLLYEMYGAGCLERSSLSLSSLEIANLEKLLVSGFRSPKCTSVGRLFDGIAALIGLDSRVTFEGQAAMKLEFLAERSDTSRSYPHEIDGMGIIDWKPMIECVLQDVKSGYPQMEIARAFHNSLIEIIVGVAKRVEQEKVVLTGGVFQNKVLTEGAIKALKVAGFLPFWHQEIPPNDGGIALGQLYSLRGKRLECV